MIEPSTKRGRKHGRHGRANKKSRGVPDISDIIGHKIRGYLWPGAKFNFGLNRVAFRLINFYERITWTLALADAFTDIAFANLYGIMQLDPSNCQEFSRFHRYNSSIQNFSAILGPTPQANLSGQDMNVGFNTSQYGCSYNASYYSVSFQAGITCNSLSIPVEVEAAIHNHTSGEWTYGGMVTLDIGESGHVSVSATCEPGDVITWHYHRTVGSFYAFQQDCLGFADLPPLIPG